MTLNMGMIDRVIRLAVAAVIVLLYLMGYLTGLWALVLGIVAVVFFVTGAIGYCPLYTVFGISTNHRPTQQGR